MKQKTDWRSCINSLTAKSVAPDRSLMSALLVSSKNKMLSQESLEMNPVTASSKLSLAYDSLRELLETLALRHGYKIYNHECYTAFMKEILHISDKGDEFDRIRKIRNAVNYYGKNITPEEAGDIILRIKNLRRFVEGLAEEKKRKKGLT